MGDAGANDLMFIQSAKRRSKYDRLKAVPVSRRTGMIVRDDPVRVNLTILDLFEELGGGFLMFGVVRKLDRQFRD